MLRQYLFYLVRWQCSTPILYLCLVAFEPFGARWATVIANLIGGLIFFWVDRYILKNHWFEVWQTREGPCDWCGKESDTLWRLVRAPGYDKNNSKPVFLCRECSERKTEQLRGNGLPIKGKTK